MWDNVLVWAKSGFALHLLSLCPHGNFCPTVQTLIARIFYDRSAVTNTVHNTGRLPVKTPPSRTARIVCGAASTKRSNVRPSVRLSVLSINSSSGVRRVCCLALRGQDISTDSCGCAAGAVKQACRAAGTGAQQRRRPSTAPSGICGQLR